MKKNTLFFIILGVVVLACVVILVFVKPYKGGYSVVYLTTGEVYVGKLQTFPSISMSDAYIYQVNKDPADSNKTLFQLQPVKDTLWAPKNIYFIKENIVFYGPLKDDSKVVQTLKEEK